MSIYIYIHVHMYRNAVNTHKKWNVLFEKKVSLEIVQKCYAIVCIWRIGVGVSSELFSFTVGTQQIYNNFSAWNQLKQKKR